MPAATNPFPGMNPYLEEFWHDVHAALLVYARNQVQRALPDDLHARVEQHLTLQDEEGGRHLGRRGDIGIVEPWSEESGGALATISGVAVAEPVLIEMDPPRKRFLQIIDSAGHIVTIIEFLSPGNKVRAEDRAEFRLKRRQVHEAGISFVEVDLVLQGQPPLEDGFETLAHSKAAYYAAIHSSHAVTFWRLFPIRLRDRLPAIAIPLREGERPVALDLQPLVDDAYRDGGYQRLNYRKDPPGPLSDEDRAWLDEHLRKQGLR